ncbi:MarR family transcriptional regulator [Mammaliicoccus stepanovicii]|uniref:Accessory regulator V n=1 Tax=Mammaliicoccus stepanovicii TaxID=643214 RepID=A0A239YFA1_9STAP|nr:helix-turn-helix domain-containing protein [Mammaliicoccus stepanovicii]PNZ75827.1 MarR family transcriptional regulator [Mammaliicoccus stepanovicii]GGI42705.1 MarR family transcriptional regulator [Mammaliicoccus stepanovicii]SNV57073.1 accessory regulator V [Mammaliicoccus stepanovicii]
MAEGFNESIQEMVNYENKLTSLKNEKRLSLVDFIILEEIYRSEEITIREILNGKLTELYSRPSNIGTNLAKLYRKGLLKKYRSESDERKVYYYMEDKQKENYVEMVKDI